VSAEVKSKEGEVKYTVQGKFTQEMTMTNVATSTTESIFKAPVFPPGPQKLEKIY